MTLKEKKEKDPREEIVISLIKGIIKQDVDSLKEFFELYSDDIYGYTIHFYNFSEDEAGDFYVYAYEHLKNGKKLSSFKGKSLFSTWFFAVLRNLTIDFLRHHKKRRQVASLIHLDPNGKIIENIEKTSSKEIDFEQEMFEKFEQQLSSIKIKLRIIFKLAYIHFLELSGEEINWISKETKKTKKNIFKKLDELKNIASVRASEVKIFEDKLTENFQSISFLENRILNYFQQNPTLKKDINNWTENYENAMFPIEINDLIKTLQKKKNKHLKLLKTQKKSLLSVRIPYKKIAEFLNLNEGVLSVQLLRIIEKLDFRI